MSVDIVTFGCRLNIAESEAMQRHAEAAGLTRMVIVNTCAVTAEASRQARQSIRRLAREKPDSTIVVTGCGAQVEPDVFAAMPEVARVMYPVLPSDPGHALWKRDFTGASGLFSIVLKPVPRAKLAAMLDGLNLFGMGYSWGGFESLITHETGQVAFWRTRAPLAGELLRLHVGLEDPADLIADLERGLAAWGAASR